jgi:hypothetical protein
MRIHCIHTYLTTKDFAELVTSIINDVTDWQQPALFTVWCHGTVAHCRVLELQLLTLSSPAKEEPNRP